MNRWCKKKSARSWKQWLAVGLSVMMFTGTAPVCVPGAEIPEDENVVMSQALEGAPKEEVVESEGLAGLSAEGILDESMVSAAGETSGEVDAAAAGETSGKTDAAFGADTSGKTDAAVAGDISGETDADAAGETSGKTDAAAAGDTSGKTDAAFEAGTSDETDAAAGETSGEVDAAAAGETSGKTDAAFEAGTSDETDAAAGETSGEVDAAAAGETSEETDAAAAGETSGETDAAFGAETSGEEKAGETAQQPVESEFSETDESFSEGMSESASENKSGNIPESFFDNESGENGDTDSETVSDSDDFEEAVSAGAVSADEDGQQEKTSEGDSVKEITPAILLSKTSFTYNGKTQEPQVTVKDGDTVLSADSYTLSYDKTPVNAGSYKVTVTLQGSYSGSASAAFEITAKKITPTVTLSSTSYTYSGKARKPSVTVKDGSTKLAASNYTVTRQSGCKNAGTYKVTVRLKGNYSGTKTVTFKITAKKITPTVTLSSTSYTYSGKARKPSVTVKAGSTKLAASNYTVTRQSGCKNVGTYKVTVRLKGNYSGTKTVTFRIVPKGTSITVGKSGKNQMAVAWKKQAVQTTGYQLQYSALGDFSKAVTVTVSNTASVSRVIKNLTCYTRYYMRVRTYKRKGSTNYYSSWSARKALDIIEGSTETFSKTPVITVSGDNMVNTISWKKVSGAGGYEVVYKKGDSGNWCVLEETTALKASHKATHGVKYYYGVRAYKEKTDGSRVYGPYSKTKAIMQQYLPQFQTMVHYPESAAVTTLNLSIKNTGKASVIFYTKNSELQDDDDSSYNRDLQLIDSSTNKNLSSVTVAAGETKTLTFKLVGGASRFESYSSIYYEFRCDSVDYSGMTDYNNNSGYSTR